MVLAKPISPAVPQTANPLWNGSTFHHHLGLRVLPEKLLRPWRTSHYLYDGATRVRRGISAGSPQNGNSERCHGAQTIPNSNSIPCSYIPIRMSAESQCMETRWQQYCIKYLLQVWSKPSSCRSEPLTILRSDLPLAFCLLHCIALCRNLPLDLKYMLSISRVTAFTGTYCLRSASSWDWVRQSLVLQYCLWSPSE